MRRGTLWLGPFLGCLLIAGGVTETVRVVRSGDGGLLPTMWTLVVPVMLVVLAIASARYASATTRTAGSPPS
jgi:hypothetical protein